MQSNLKSFCLLSKCLLVLCLAMLLSACQTSKSASENTEAEVAANTAVETSATPSPAETESEEMDETTEPDVSPTTEVNAEEEKKSKHSDPRPLWKRILFFWQKPPAPQAAPLQSIASVYTSNPVGKFAIIESPSAASLIPGTRLIAITNGTITGTVRISPDRQPPFLIADILDGNLKSGDLLYIKDVQ